MILLLYLSGYSSRKERSGKQYGNKSLRFMIIRFSLLIYYSLEDFQVGTIRMTSGFMCGWSTLHSFQSDRNMQSPGDKFHFTDIRVMSNIHKQENSPDCLRSPMVLRTHRVQVVHVFNLISIFIEILPQGGSPSLVHGVQLLSNNE